MSWDKIVVDVVGLGLIGFIVWFFWLVKAKGVKAALTSGGYQEQLVLVKGGYTPDVIVVERGRGGIPMQIPEGYGRYLVEDVQECADRILELLADPEQRDAYGRAGREHIRSHFLLPRLVRDSLALVKSLL